MTIHYRVANSNDIAILADNRLLFALEMSGQQSQESIAALRAQMMDCFSKTMQDDSIISIIAECNGEVAGIGSVHLRELPGNFKNPSGKWAYIMNMYTVPSHRRKGVCTGLLNELINSASKKGFTAFDLHATKEGEFVYLQNGFELHKEPTYRKFL